MFNFIIERMIKKSENEGGFENLLGAGKPLDLSDKSRDAVMNKLLKNYNAKPAAVGLNQEIQAGYARLKTLTEEGERKVEMKKLADLQTRYAIQVEAYKKYG